MNPKCAKKPFHSPLHPLHHPGQLTQSWINDVGAKF